MKKFSINSRLSIVTTVVLSFFLGIAGWALGQAYEQGAETALQERLQSQLYAIIAATDMGKNGRMFMPQNLPEPRLSTPGSGLYAQIISADEAQQWRSPSAMGITLAFPQGLERGASRFEKITSSEGEDLYSFNLGLAWEVAGSEEAFTFSVAENMVGYNTQLTLYRQNLWGWLVGVALLLLVVQAALLRWGLAPLRQVAEDLRAIERGEATQLEGTYPNELNGLTSNLNALIRSEREQLNRYRNSLSDLAHSLKTPLAILQNEIDSRHPTQQSTLVEQVERMSQLVDYQLQRAASAGRTTLAAPLVIEPLVKRVVASLDKVYADKALRITLAVDAALTFQGDKSDLLEIFGNLLDNAYKWAKQQVTIKVTCDTLNEGKLARLTVTIEDDGPGIPEEKARLVLQRGGRADEQVGGHGIGLAVVRDIVQLYDGQLEIAKSTLGGARVCFYLYA